MSSLYIDRIRMLEEITKVPAFSFMDSMTIRSINKLTESRRLDSLDLQSSTFNCAAQELFKADSTAFDMLQKIQAMEQLRGLSSIGALENSLLCSQEITAMESIKKLVEPRRLGLIGLQESAIKSAAQELFGSGSTAFDMSQKLQAMEQLRGLSSIGATKALENSSLGYQEITAMESIKKLVEPRWLDSIGLQESAIKSVAHELFGSGSVAFDMLQKSQALEAMQQLSGLSSFKALKSLKNSPFLELAINLIPDNQILENRLTIIDEYLLEIEKDSSEELTSNTDFNTLSEETKNRLKYIYHFYLLPILLGCLVTLAMHNHLEDTRKELESVSSISDVKSVLRNSPGYLERGFLKNYRITTAQRLNLRKKPSMKSEIVGILPLGTLVEVLDKSSKSWLLVEVEIDGKIEQGWISRKYTYYLK